MSVLIKPIVTEKLTLLAERGKQKQYGFLVDIDANKIQVKQAVEKAYGVQVASLRSSISPAKRRTRMTKGGVINGKTSRTKKVYVTLAAGQEIDFYKNV
jgi:large subunit ribosomal protein L23